MGTAVWPRRGDTGESTCTGEGVARLSGVLLGGLTQRALPAGETRQRTCLHPSHAASYTPGPQATLVSLWDEGTAAVLALHFFLNFLNRMSFVFWQTMRGPSDSFRVSLPMQALAVPIVGSLNVDVCA